MRRGEQRAFDQFFDAYASRLAAFAARRCSLDAAGLEDVVQVTMINAMRGLGTFRGGSTLFTWLCQICRNHLADVRRKAERQPKVQSLEQLEAKKPPGTVVELTDFRDPLDECADDSTRSAVRRAVNQLPASYARILELRFGDDLTVPEIATMLQLSESAAESRIVACAAGIPRKLEWRNRRSGPCSARSSGIRMSESTNDGPAREGAAERALREGLQGERPCRRRRCSASAQATEQEWRAGTRAAHAPARTWLLAGRCRIGGRARGGIGWNVFRDRTPGPPTARFSARSRASMRPASSSRGLCGVTSP